MPAPLSGLISSAQFSCIFKRTEEDQNIQSNSCDLLAAFKTFAAIIKKKISHNNFVLIKNVLKVRFAGAAPVSLALVKYA